MGSGAVLGLAPAPEYTFLIYVSPVGNYFKVCFILAFSSIHALFASILSQLFCHVIMLSNPNVPIHAYDNSIKSTFYFPLNCSVFALQLFICYYSVVNIKINNNIPVSCPISLHNMCVCIYIWICVYVHVCMYINLWNTLQNILGCS